MSSKTSVDPGDLRAAAHAEDAISDDMTGKNRKAISATKDAGASLKGWSLSQALLTVADTWEPSLDGMRRRAATGASNLRTCADGHEWNDAAASKDFEQTGAQTQSAPQTMSASAGPGGVGSEGHRPMPGADSLRDSFRPDSTIGGPGAVGSEGRHAMPGAGSLRDNLSGGPGGVGSEGHRPMPGADSLRDSLRQDSTIGGPGAVGSEGASPVQRPAFVDRENGTRPARDSGAHWTAEEMQNAKPMRTPTVDSPFG
ncbi:hypothetical protein ACFCVY_08435 [Streptomyces sp. NPDC056411]|uniref:hypothetical protein n=1 Tax=Streptomyces sp. NPDC056411 TaxID=3345813 RepID=UPI0035E2B083